MRKLRWGTSSRGKRDGIRVIYYGESAERIYLLFVYDKVKQGDLTRPQLKMLRDYIKGGVL